MEKYSLDIATDNIENMNTVMSFFEEHSASIENLKAIEQLTVVVEELALNVFTYAYDNNPGNFTLTMLNDSLQRRVVLEFRDAGKEYNPLSRHDPDLTLPIEKREIGGLGILMSKKLTDEQYYLRENGQNVLTVVKNY